MGKLEVIVNNRCKDNLELLGNFLLSDKYNNIEFDLLCGGLDINCKQPNPNEYKKMTAATSYQFGPFLGKKFKPLTVNCSWHSYIETYFEMGLDEYEWCWGLRWLNSDQSRGGAGKRILWILENKIPENVYYQMVGAHKLCYL